MNNSPSVIWRYHKALHKYLGLHGKIVVWTKVYVAPVGFEHEAPYIAAIVEFENKKRMSVQVVDCDEYGLKYGQKVVGVIRRIGKAAPDGLILYGVKVKPIK